MGQIPIRRLTDAENHFRSIVQGSQGLRSRDIDWKVVEKQLLRLQTAVQQDDVVVFDEALAMLKARLAPSNVLRGNIFAEPENKSTVMPPQVFELINHVVDTLHLETTQQSSPKEKKGESDKKH